MKTAKVLLCIALSFSVLFVGIGFAAVSKTLSFSGSLDFQHTGLYISNITAGDGVAVQGYSGTLINLTATKGSTMTVILQMVKLLQLILIKIITLIQVST